MTSKTPFSQVARQWMDIFLHRSWRSWNHLARSAGLTMPQFGILMQVHHRGTCAVSHISEHFDITNAAASQLVDKLVHSGLLQRQEDPADRRARLLNLTETGREFVQRGMEERYRWLDRLAEKLTAEECEKITEALSIMARVAQDLEAEPSQPAA